MFFLFFFDTCTSCCRPDGDGGWTLFLEFHIPLIIMFFLLICFWEEIRIKLKAFRKSRFELSHVFHGQLPREGTQNYKAYSYNLIQDYWVAEKNQIFSFNENEITLHEVNIEANNIFNRREGNIEKNSFLNISTNVLSPGFRLYISAVEGIAQLGFFGFEANNASKKLWAFLPIESNANPNLLFPYSKNFCLMILFGLLLLLSSSCLLTFSFMNENGFYGDFHANPAPWGAYISFFCLGVFFFSANPFGWSFRNIDKDLNFCSLCIVIPLVITVCFFFSVYDITSAEFLTRESLIDARGNYTLDHTEINDICKIRQYNCSVYWSNNLTQRNNDCPNDFIYDCVSFNPVMGSCSDGKDEIFNLFFFQGVFHGLLCVFWLFVIFALDLEYSQWPAVSQKIKTWNKVKKLRNSQIMPHRNLN